MYIKIKTYFKLYLLLKAINLDANANLDLICPLYLEDSLNKSADFSKEFVK